MPNCQKKKHFIVLMISAFILLSGGVFFGTNVYAAITTRTCDTALRDQVAISGNKNDKTVFLGCACNYIYTDTTGSLLMQCPPDSVFTCSKNNYTGVKTDVPVNTGATSKRNVSTFCLIKGGAVGVVCSDDSECEGNSRCESGACVLDIGERAVEGIAGGETGDLRDTIRRFINIALGFLGIAAVIMLLYGGFLWLTAGGSDDKVTKGKNIMVWALIGLVVISIAWTIGSYVLRLGRELGAG